MNKYPDFLIEKIDTNDNSIYAYTRLDLGEKQQWRWFAANIMSMYIPIYKNFKIYLFTTKKQTLKYLDFELKKEEIHNDTKNAFKIFIENNDTEVVVWTNPLCENGEKIIYKKDDMLYSNFIPYYDNFISSKKFIDLSFKTEHSIIEINSTKTANDLFISINKQPDESFYIYLIVAYINMFYQGSTIKSIAKTLNVTQFFSRFIFGNQTEIQTLKQLYLRNEHIQDFLYKNGEHIYGLFISSQNFIKEENESSLSIYPYNKQKKVSSYEPMFFCFPVDKEYFKI